MKNLYHSQQQELQAFLLLRRALSIAFTLSKLSKFTGISRSTLTRISAGNYKGTRATRARLDVFIENNIHNIDRLHELKREV